MIKKWKPYFLLSRRDQRSVMALTFILIISSYLPKVFDQAIASNSSSFSKKIATPKHFQQHNIASPISYSKSNTIRLKHQNYIDFHHQAATMNFNDWDSLAIFDRKEIFELLKWRKLNGGRVSWKALVVKFDLSEAQARAIKKKINIED